MKIFTALLISSFLLVSDDSALKLESNPLFEHALLGYYVAELDSNKVVAASNENKMLAPASVLKLFSTSVALDELGPSYKQNSFLYINGTVAGGVLTGDVVFDPNFNPSLGAVRFGQNLETVADQLASALKAKGIQQITGAVKVLETVSYSKRIPRTWIWEDMGNYYGAGFSRACWNENSIDLVFSSAEPGTAAQLLKTDPELPFLKIDSEVLSSTVNRDLAYCFSRPDDDQISVSGTIPQGKSYFVVKAALPNPAKAMAYLFSQSLVKKGILMKGEPSVTRELPVGGQKIAELASAEVGTIVQQTNLNSINFFAEALLNLAHQHSKSEQTMQDWFKGQLQKNVDMTGATVYDASGLSRFNAVSAKQTASLIRYALKGQNKEQFDASLAVAGRTGTLKSLLRKSPANGYVKGKSGSMSGVRCYAGVVTAVSGKQYVFAVLLNNHDADFGEVRPVLENWLSAIFEK